MHIRIIEREASTKLNRTTLRTVKILKLVSKKLDGITLDEICARLDMPKTSAHDIVITLIQTDMIHAAGEQRQRYTIGLTAYRIGINYTSNLDSISTIDPVLKASSREMGKTVFFGIRPDNSIVHICKFEPENPVITTAIAGTRSPIYYTSLGKAAMAYTEDEGRGGVLSRISFKGHTDRTIYTKEEFERELKSVREEGYAFDARELEEHMECVEAPISGQDGNAMGVISASSLHKPTEDYDALGRLVSDKGAQLSRLLGYIGHAQENKLIFLPVLLLTNHVTAIRI